MSEGVNIYPPFAACDDVTRLWWNRSPRSQRIISEKLSTMSGVCQTGTFATLHRLKSENLPQMERDLKAFSAGHPIALVLRAEIIALHDCGIKTYTHEILAHLRHPIANPHVDCAFCKGYYARVTDRINGRAIRRYVTPLLRSLKPSSAISRVSIFWTAFAIPCPASLR